jgi:hypothetical protein
MHGRSVSIDLKYFLARQTIVSGSQSFLNSISNLFLLIEHLKLNEKCLSEIGFQKKARQNCNLHARQHLPK